MISLSTHPTLVHQLMAMIAFAEKSHITLTEYPIEITCHRQMFNQMDSQRFLLLVIKEKELLWSPMVRTKLPQESTFRQLLCLAIELIAKLARLLTILPRVQRMLCTQCITLRLNSGIGKAPEHFH